MRKDRTGFEQFPEELEFRFLSEEPRFLWPALPTQAPSHTGRRLYNLFTAPSLTEAAPWEEGTQFRASSWAGPSDRACTPQACENVQMEEDVGLQLARGNQLCGGSRERTEVRTSSSVSPDTSCSHPH